MNNSNKLIIAVLILLMVGVDFQSFVLSLLFDGAFGLVALYILSKAKNGGVS